MFTTPEAQLRKSVEHSNEAAIMRVIHPPQTGTGGTGVLGGKLICVVDAGVLGRLCMFCHECRFELSSPHRPPSPGRRSTSRWCSRRSSRCPHCCSRTAARPRADPTGRYRRTSRATTAFLPAQRAMSTARTTKLCLLRRLAQEGVEERLCRLHAVGRRQPLRFRAPIIVRVRESLFILEIVRSDVQN